MTEHPDISSVEWAVAMALSMRMDNKSGECHPGFTSLGEVTRLSRSSVKKAVKGLEQKGLIRVRRRRLSSTHNDTNYYTALLPGAHSDLPRAQGDTGVGRQASPVSSETQGEDQEAQEQTIAEAAVGAGESQASARLQNPEPRESDLPARLKNLPPDHPAVLEHRRSERDRDIAEAERLFGGPTSDELDKEKPRG